MHPVEFQRKWRHAAVTERSGAQQHFLDLCELVGAPKPMDVVPDGAFYTFERGAEKLDGSNGWADVWYRDHFAWEYKGPGRDLAKAYRQLNQYRENLDNPPLLVVSDLDTIEVHTNFTGTAKQVHRLTLDTIAESESLRVLRALFFAPDELRPNDSMRHGTEECKSGRWTQAFPQCERRSSCAMAASTIPIAVSFTQPREERLTWDNARRCPSSRWIAS